MRATPARSFLRFLILIIAAVVWLAAPSAQTQRPDAAALRAQMAQLQRSERSLLELQGDLQDYLSPDVIVLINPYAAVAPVPMALANYRSVLMNWVLLSGEDWTRAEDTVRRILDMAIPISNELKRQIRERSLPDVERELTQVRQQLNQLAQKLAIAERPAVPGQVQAGPPSDAGEGWFLERALAGLNDGARAQVLSQSATAAGGDVTMRYQVTATCSETWHMSWTFSPDIRFVYQGVRIRTTLRTELVGPGCNYRVGSYLAVGEGTRMEGFIDTQVPADRQEARVIESENLPRAQSSSADPVTSAATSGELVVRRQPVRWPSYTVLRMYAYVPGTTLTIAYVFRAN